MRIYDAYPNQVIELDYYVLDDLIQVTWCATNEKSSRLNTDTLFFSSLFFSSLHCFADVCCACVLASSPYHVSLNINIIKGPFLSSYAWSPSPVFEYMAMSEATKEAMYLRQLLQDINMLPQPAPTIIYCDNQAAIQLTKTESQHNRAKHIDIRHHFVRDAIRRKIVTFKYVNSENNTADILTKAIPTPQHQKLVKQLNLKVKSASSSGGNMDKNTRRWRGSKWFIGCILLPPTGPTTP